MDVQCLREADLTPELDREILELQHAAFPKTAEFTRQRWYHAPPAPEDLWFTARRGDRLVAGVRLVHRRIRSGRSAFLAAGIGNVCSHPEARGTGAATACLRAAGDAIARRADFGLLFCTPANAGYYARLGWVAVENDVTFVDAAGAVKTAHSGRWGAMMILPGATMMLAGRRTVADWPRGTIDLCGPDW